MVNRDPSPSSGEQRVVVITGAAGGIGLATARILASQGARIVAIDLDADTLGESVAILPVDGANPHIPQALDVADHLAVQNAVDSAHARCGRIDALVNCAGIAGPSRPSWEVDPDEWAQVLSVNLTGTFNLVRAVVPHMRRQGRGHVVNVSSIAGKEGNPNAVAYSASKAGVIALTKSVAKEVATDGVVVNCVTPALITSPMNEQVSAEHFSYMLDRIPMRRAGEPDEVGQLISWLVSERCSFSTGAVFDISGGRATY